jgi:hypothetical protein
MISFEDFPPQICNESYRLSYFQLPEKTSCRVVVGNEDFQNFFFIGKHKIPKLPECKTLKDAFPPQISAESYRL